MGRQKVFIGRVDLVQKNREWHRGRVSGFNPLTSKYEIQPAGNPRVKPVTVSADRLKENTSEYTPGEKIQFQQPDSKNWQDGIIDRPASPTEYKVIGDDGNWTVVKSKIRKRH